MRSIEMKVGKCFVENNLRLQEGGGLAGCRIRVNGRTGREREEGKYGGETKGRKSRKGEEK